MPFVVSRFRLRLFLSSLFLCLLLLGRLLMAGIDFSSLKYIGGSYGRISNGIGANNIRKKAYNALNNKQVWTELLVKQDSGKKKESVTGDILTGIKLENQDSRSKDPDSTKNSALDEKSVPLSSSTSTLHIQATTTMSKTRDFPSSTQSFLSISREAKVYGEPGCPDNPWRNAGLKELFQAWVDICKRHNIEYVLFGGSLLGAMRNKDIIPYDSDIDVLIDVNYYSVVKSLSEERNFVSSDRKIHLVLQPEFAMNISVDARKRYDCQGKVTPNMRDQCSFQEPLGRLIKGNLHIDLYHFYERVNSYDDPSDNNLKEYPKKDFYPFRPCSFLGFEASCPNNPREILRIYFRTDNFLEPSYKCKNGTWVDKNGKTPRPFRTYYKKAIRNKI